MLKKKICLFVFLLVARKECFSFEFKPYIGFDQQINRVRFKEGYGDNIFQKHYPQANLYIGANFKNPLSIEYGYISTISKNKCSILHTNDVVLGTRIPRELSPATFLSYIQIRGPHLSFLYNFSPESFGKFRIKSGLGVAFLKSKAEVNAVCMGNDFVLRGNVRKFNKEKVVLRLLIAPEYKLKDSVGVRASVCFLQTSKMVMKAQPNGYGGHTPLIKPKDSLVYSLGIFLDF